MSREQTEFVRTDFAARVCHVSHALGMTIDKLVRASIRIKLEAIAAQNKTKN